MLPLVPVTDNTDVPAGVLEGTDTVRVLVVLPVGMVLGAKLAEAPFGSPPTDNATAELNPFNLATDNVNAVELPTFTLAPVGLGDRANVPAGTVTLNTMVRTNPPPVPVTVTGKVPAVALEFALTVIVTGALGLRVGQENDTVKLGDPLAADRVTRELNPPCAVIVSAAVWELPGGTLRLKEFDANEKLEARLLAQLLTRRKASSEPSPVVMS
jgi:hypothetical protein